MQNKQLADLKKEKENCEEIIDTLHDSIDSNEKDIEEYSNNPMNRNPDTGVIFDHISEIIRRKLNDNRNYHNIIIYNLEKIDAIDKKIKEFNDNT